MGTIEALRRSLMDNRRHRPRRRFVYETVLYDDCENVLFRGKTSNLSLSGARLVGLPVGVGVTLGQAVRVEFLVLPKDLEDMPRRIAVRAHIWRVEEEEDSYTLGLKFVEELPT
jgi:hypothetical protein